MMKNCAKLNRARKSKFSAAINTKFFEDMKLSGLVKTGFQARANSYLIELMLMTKYLNCSSKLNKQKCLNHRYL